MRGRRRGVSSVIGMAFLSVLLVAMLVALHNTLRTVEESAAASREAVVAATSVPECARATWEYSGGNATIVFANECSEALNVTGISLELIDSTLIALDKLNYPQLPKTVAPGSTATFEIDVASILGSPKQVTGASLAVLHLSTGVTVAIDATQPPAAPGAPVSNATYSLLPLAYNDGTVTWLGKMTVQQQETRGTITLANIVVGTGTVNPPDLEDRDGAKATITSTYTSLNLILVDNNTLYYDPFTTNPIGTRMTVLSGTWIHSTAQGGYIEQTTQSSSSFSRFGILSNTALPSSPTSIYVIAGSRITDWGTVAFIFFITGSMDILLSSDSVLSSYYTLAAERRPVFFFFDVTRLAIYVNGTLDSFTFISLQDGRDYVLLANYDKIAPRVKLNLYDENLNLVGSVQTSDNITVRYPGFSTLPSSVRFYYLYVVEERDPRFFYVAGLPPGWSLEFRDANNNVYAAGPNPANSSEWRVSVLRPNALREEPVVQGTLYVYDGQGNLAAQFPGTYWGGSEYLLEVNWSVVLEVDTVIDLTGVPPVFDLYADALASANVSGVFLKLDAFNFTSSSYETVATSTGSINALAYLDSQN
nr:hypothetical protein [Desulfurococcales archaeon]